MSFLVLLLALLVEKLSAGRQCIQRDGLWVSWLRRCEANPRLARSPGWTLVLLVLLPLLLLGLLLQVIAPLAYGWLVLPVDLLVIIYSLGRGDPLASMGPFRDAWRRDDAEAAFLVAERDFQVNAEDVPQLLRQAQGYLLWEGYQGFFAVVFWYALLGPLPALAYRLLALVEQHSAQPGQRALAGQWRHALDWLPVRALAASFGLVGDFVAVNRVLLHELLNWEISAKSLVLDTGLAGSDEDTVELGEQGVASLDELWQLLVRSAVLWYGVMAAIALYLQF